jgi:hypothetical protein
MEDGKPPMEDDQPMDDNMDDNMDVALGSGTYIAGAIVAFACIMMGYHVSHRV